MHINFTFYLIHFALNRMNMKQMIQLNHRATLFIHLTWRDCESHHCFLQQEMLPSLLSTDCFNEI